MAETAKNECDKKAKVVYTAVSEDDGKQTRTYKPT